jgi:hypothetical protein
LPNCFEESDDLKWCRAVTALLLIKWELRASGHRSVTVEKSRSHPGVGNDHTGAQLPPHGATCVVELEPAGIRLHFSTFSSHTVLRHNGSRPASQRRLACTPTATYVAHSFQAINFKLHPYDMEK